ncbi:MAG: hypothetical protein IJ111_03755 [Eggerthellaceae bacterium]|nr:hypothetical protein [Eggerthellaceae bacterium]
MNFFDNGWDPGFGEAILLGDYTRLAGCSPDVPEATTPGHAVKAWERNDDGIYLVKAAEYPDGAELVGAKLGSDLCALFFGEGCYVPLDVVERFGRPCSVSPLMLGRGEELADGNRLCATADMWESPIQVGGGITTEACDALIDAYTAIGVADASAHVAGRACFSCLSLLLDFNPGNVGARTLRLGAPEFILSETAMQASREAIEERAGANRRAADSQRRDHVGLSADFRSQASRQVQRIAAVSPCFAFRGVIG